MHICFISTYFPQPCGIASYVHYLTESLHFSDPLLQISILAEKPAYESTSRLFHVSGIFDRAADYPEQILPQVKRIAPDIVHIQHEYGIFGVDDRFFRLLSQLRDLKIRTVVTLHTVHTRLSLDAGCAAPHLRHLLKKVNIEEYQRRIGELVDLVIVHQENTIRQVLLRQGLSPDRVITVPHGTRILETVDVPKAKAMFGIGPATPFIVAFGYLEESKNLLLLIEAFHRLKKHMPAAKLWLGGYVRFPTTKALRYRDRCLRRIEAYGLRNDIIFSDSLLPEEKVPTLLSAADVACFVYDEDTHSSSGALHLAMGLGKAVVAARIPKFQELADVCDEILVNPRSVREASQLLNRLLVDESFHMYVKQKISSYAQLTAWSSIAQKHWAIYDQLFALQDSGIMYPTAHDTVALSLL